ncbi:MAG: glycosyl hydrolase 2 galactose-binding domain-containing protein, partial [Planctomycetota bacterium]
MKTSSLTVLCLTAVALLLAGSARADAAEYAWFEGERPAEADIEVPPHAWDGGQLLSEGGWAGISIPADEVEERIPEGGATIAYDFSVGATGDYQVWGRIGMEYVRAPFDWRLDDGPWDRVTLWDAEDQTIDLMELGRWKSIGWLKMGRARLESGQHRLTIRIPVPYKEDEDGNKQPQRIIWTADAFCVYLGDFRPNGKHKPGADWQSERDREAAEKVFEMPPVESPRVETALHGLWQMGRFDETGLVTDREGPVPLPDHPLHWESMSVPGDRHAQLPDTVFNHRYFLRTRVRIPGGHAGRSFFLDVAELSCFATVYVNGRRVGHRTVPFAPWRLDVTDAVRPSGVNEIWIGVKDRYYALTGSRRHHGNPRYSFHTPLEYLRGNQGVTMRYDYPVRNTHANGLLDRLTLTSTGPVYASGVFVKPSVKDDRLAAEVTLSNSGEGARAVTVSAHVEPWNRGEGGEAALHLPSQRVEAPAGGGKTVELKRSDEDGLPLKLWWPDRPQLYQLVTTVRDGEKVLDVERTRFGYRDWDIRGTRFYLNGMPYQLRADLTGYGAAPGEGEALVKKWREYGQTMFRLRFQREWSGMTQRQVLGFMDEHGVPVRRTISTFDGQHASYGLTKRDDEGNKIPNKPLFDNWRRQIRARLLRERNHPCVFMWELDNEIIYINTRNFGNLDVVEPEFT